MSHYKINNTLYASILSAIVASLTFQIIGYFVVGYLDPFFIPALVIGAGIAFCIALVIGLPFTYIRRTKQNQENKRS